MKVRRYIAATVPEAMAQVKAELGLDAVILHTHSIRQGGFFGFFGRKMVEVTAAIEEDLPARPQIQETLPNRGSSVMRAANEAYRHGSLSTSRTAGSESRYYSDDDEAVVRARGSNRFPEADSGTDAREAFKDAGQGASSRDDSAELRSFLDRFREHVGGDQVVSGFRHEPLDDQKEEQSDADEAGHNSRSVKEMQTAALPADEMTIIRRELQETKALLQQLTDMREEPQLEKAIPELPKRARRIWQQLVANDIDADLATELLHGVLADSTASANDEDLDSLLQLRVMQLLEQAVPEPRVSTSPEIVALVGPTGVGKTTTLAKLAAYAALVEKKKVGLITIDTYRIAAVEQLKTYAKILNLQVHVVFTPRELPEVIAQMADYDIIFLDTAGRSHKNAMQMSELKAFFDAGRPTKSYLVLSLTTKFSDMMEIVAHFEPLNLDTLIFTKLDETATYGSIFNLVVLLQKKVAYLTNGQSVPEDINPVDLQTITDLVLGKRNYA